MSSTGPDLTNLIDLMTVLAATFLLLLPVARLAEFGVQLPKTQDAATSGAVGEGSTPTVAISLSADGGVLWDGESTSWEGIESRLSAAANLSPRPALQLAGDAEAPYASVAQLLRLVQQHELELSLLHEVSPTTTPEKTP